MLNLAQRLILGCVLLAGLILGLLLVTHRALQAAGQWKPALALALAAILVEVGTVFFVLRPIHGLATDAHKIAQGNLEHRTAWNSRDDFGVIAAELNRLAVRLRDLHDSEAGRRQMEFQLSDAVLQSIFEPIIVTDGKGHILKVNQAAAELLGEAAGDRMALANTPGGDKILSAIRDAVALQKAVATEDEASMLPMRIGKKERSYRMRTTPAGHRHHARRRDQPAGHRPLQDAVSQRSQPQAARSAAGAAARTVCAWPGLRRRVAAAAGGVGGCGGQRVRKAGRADGRPD
jgi:HAMP domain-containing protein